MALQFRMQQGGIVKTLRGHLNICDQVQQA